MYSLFRHRARKIILRFWTYSLFRLPHNYIITVFKEMCNVQVEEFVKIPFLHRWGRHFNKMYSYSHGRQYYSMKQTTRILGKTSGNSINIHLGNYRIPKEIKRFGKWIQIDFDDSISDSPRRQPDGSFVLWEEDLTSPIFICMLIDKIKELIC